MVLSVVGLDRVEGPPVWAGQRAHEELAPDVPGPRPEDLVDMARRTLGARGEYLRIVPTWRGVPFGPEMAGEALLPGRGARVGATTFDGWLLDEWRTA